MRVSHTADWHIGQLSNEYDRTYEHQQFLDWLLAPLTPEKIDVLLVSGDVFDLSNRSAASIKMFYFFLNQAVKQNLDLQIIVTAGNHDSVLRLESLKPLLILAKSRIHIHWRELRLPRTGHAGHCYGYLLRLHNQGPKVCTISHFQEMAERVPVQIKLCKMQSGKSKVKVAGVYYLN